MIIQFARDSQKFRFISFGDGQLTLEFRAKAEVVQEHSLHEGGTEIGTVSATIHINVKNFSIAYSDAVIEGVPKDTYTTGSVGHQLTHDQDEGLEFFHDESGEDEIDEVRVPSFPDASSAIDSEFGEQYVVQTSEVRQVRKQIALLKKNTVLNFDDVILAIERFLSVLPTAWTPDAEKPAVQLAKQLKSFLTGEHWEDICPLVSLLHRLALKQQVADLAVFEKMGGSVLLEQLKLLKLFDLEQSERLEQLARVSQV